MVMLVKLWYCYAQVEMIAMNYGQQGRSSPQYLQTKFRTRYRRGWMEVEPGTDCEEILRVSGRTGKKEN